MSEQGRSGRLASTRERQERAPRQRRHRGAGCWVLAVVVVVVLAGLGVTGYARISRPLPVPPVSLALISSVQPPRGAGFTFPADARQSSVAVSGVAGSWDSGGGSAVPIASVTKMMTAYLVLRDHPLAADADNGPTITVTSADADEYATDVAHGDSSAAVAAGERLTERQALEALLLPSADNIATLLAAWDAGSVTGFVAKMNAQAHALGMAHTDYTDPSGLAASTVSTARDQLIVVQKAMAVTAFAHIVALRSASIPVAGTIANYNHQAGTNGIIGVKTGSDSAAQGCWAFAVQQVIAGTRHVVYGVVLGAPYSTTDPLGAAISGGITLAGSAPKAIAAVTALPAGTVVARLRVPWSSTSVNVVTTRAITGLLGPGGTVSLHASVSSPGPSFRSGQQLGTVTATGLTDVTSTPVITQGAAGTPSLKWRLLHS